MPFRRLAASKVVNGVEIIVRQTDSFTPDSLKTLEDLGFQFSLEYVPVIGEDFEEELARLEEYLMVLPEGTLPAIHVRSDGDIRIPIVLHMNPPNDDMLPE